MKDKPEYCAGIFKVLGQETRIGIVETLRNGELCVSDIHTLMGKEQSNTSRHISVMYTNGILACRKSGHRTFYKIKHQDSVLALIDSAKRGGVVGPFTETLKVLGQMTRMKIVEALRAGELPLGELIRKVGGEQSNTSHHLALMLDVEIVSTRREGCRSLYRLANEKYVLNLVDTAVKVMTQENQVRQMVLH